MKKIGFVDYYIDEWHANNYPAWIENANKKLGLDFEFCYVWAELEKSPNTGVSTSEWCEKMGVTECASIDELCEKCDAIFILAPTDPYKHLEYAKKVFKYGKPTYVDKTFAENLDVAEQIKAEADKYKTPFFSTSALRYAEELPLFDGAKNLFVSFGGRSLEEYVIHAIEIAVVNKNADVKRVKVENAGKMKSIHAETEHGSELLFAYSYALPFVVCAEYDDRKGTSKKIESSFFDVLIEKILVFFESAVPPFEFEETVSAMKFRDLVLAADKKSGEWVYGE